MTDLQVGSIVFIPRATYDDVGAKLIAHSCGPCRKSDSPHPTCATCDASAEGEEDGYLLCPELGLAVEHWFYCSGHSALDSCE